MKEIIFFPQQAEVLALPNSKARWCLGWAAQAQERRLGNPTHRRPSRSSLAPPPTRALAARAGKAPPPPSAVAQRPTATSLRGSQRPYRRGVEFFFILHRRDSACIRDLWAPARRRRRVVTAGTSGLRKDGAEGGLAAAEARGKLLWLGREQQGHQVWWNSLFLTSVVVPLYHSVFVWFT